MAKANVVSKSAATNIRSRYFSVPPSLPSLAASSTAGMSTAKHSNRNTLLLLLPSLPLSLPPTLWLYVISSSVGFQGNSVDSSAQSTLPSEFTAHVSAFTVSHISSGVAFVSTSPDQALLLAVPLSCG